MAAQERLARPAVDMQRPLNVGSHAASAAECAATMPASLSPQPSARGGIRDCVVLGIVASNAAMNAFLSINTSAAEDAFAEMLDVSLTQVQSLYSLMLAVVMVGMTPGVLFTVKYEGAGIFFSCLTSAAAGWLRWLSVHQRSFRLCALSTAVNGAGAWTILSLPAQISQRRFPSHRWTLTTSVAIMANYTGWLIGSLVPAVAATVETLDSYCFWQAWITPLPAVAFLFGYRSPSKEVLPPQADGETGHGARDGGDSHDLSDGSFCDFFRVAMAHPSFVAQVVACGCLGGVSFAQPSAAVLILEACGFPNSVSTWINVAFLASGIIAGIVLGNYCKERRLMGIMLKTLFILSVVSIATCAILADTGWVKGGDNLSLIVIMLLSAAAGVATLGFIGVGIEAVSLYPVGPAYACWAVEILVQGVGAGLNIWAASGGRSGFNVLALAAGFSALCMVFGFRLPPRDDNLDAAVSNLS